MENISSEILGKNSNKKNRLSRSERVLGQDQFRVVVCKEANSVLEEVVAKVNKGFEGGEVARSDIANYVFSNLSKTITDSDIQSLRSLHFDEKKVLSSLLKKMGEQDDMPEEIKRALREHYGVLHREKKRPARPRAVLTSERQEDGPSAA